MKARLWALLFCVCSFSVWADKPAPPEVDPFQSGQAAYDAEKYQQARKLWLPLANHGDVRAQYALGRLYEKGKGVDRDFNKAYDWYQKAAQKNHPDSQYRVAVGLAMGVGIAKNEPEALSWLRKAANNNQKRAQKVLAQAYEEGRLGLKADPVQAKYWYDRAKAKP